MSNFAEMTFAELQVVVDRSPAIATLTADELIERMARLEGLHPSIRSTSLVSFGALRVIAEQYLQTPITQRFTFLRRFRDFWELVTLILSDQPTAKWCE